MQENLREMQELSLDELEMVSGGDAVPAGTESDVKSPPGSADVKSPPGSADVKSPPGSTS